MVATSLNHPPFSAGHVLATTQTAWIPTQRIPRNRQKLALVLLVVVIYRFFLTVLVRIVKYWGAGLNREATRVEPAFNISGLHD